MIFDRIENLHRYRGLHPNLDRAIDRIGQGALSTLPAGRTELLGDEVFVNRGAYTTAPFGEDTLYEVHARYADLHLLLSGSERTAVTPQDGLSWHKSLEEEDSVLYRGPEGDTLTLDPDTFLLLFPGEIHAARLMAAAPVPVEKLVFKLAMD